jgi:hypothetical protein
MVADGGAVIRPACRDARLPDCSLLLIHGNFTNLGSVAAVVLDEIRLFEFHSLDQCLDPVLAELGHSQMRARPLKNGAPGRLKVGPTSGNALAGRFHVGEHESRSAPSSPT